MTIIAVILTAFLEQRKLINKIRCCFQAKLEQYIQYFSNRSINNQRELRLTYLFAAAPVAIILLALKFILIKHWITYTVLNIFLFALSVQILTWKEEAKNENAANNRSFITTYATRFFVPLFWFLILPSAIGSICYLIVMLLSSEMKSKNLDSMIYNVVVDKMLFYVNVVPYTLLFLLIAFAGNFEEASHYLVEQRKEFTKSFYQLENMLNQMVLLAIGKDKFQIGDFERQVEGLEADNLDNERFNPEITDYIVAILYRAGLFFVGLLALFNLATLF